MSLLTLRDIGKIYVSEGNVAVGIRGVSLSFDRGEFVAITGKSGSGKSTLLNVISGMDTYEEGELLIDGAPTSHYLQPDWERYREKYISFIFQDYNIIESFTVLQNVELALMHITDPRARRARALELLERVGLSSHIRQKGSRLSGGQKQRTVIARALAKDSPIILADEPTGNLDAATSHEIISLLREVSRDKLLIVVTHNFEEVAECATRHVRIYDGAVESDDVIRCPAPAEESSPAPVQKPRGRRDEIRSGFSLGSAVFFAKPKLSVFLCLLLLVGTLGVFAVTTLCGSGITVFDKHYMFTPTEGRVILASQSGEVLPESELARIAEEYGADSYLACDYLLDSSATLPWVYVPELDTSFEASCTLGKSYGNRIVGRYPQAKDEVLLYLPIWQRPDFGKNTPRIEYIMLGALRLRITGVAYYYDNNLKPELLFTEEGFRTATNALYLSRGSFSVQLTLTGGESKQYFSYAGFVPSFDIESGKIYIDDSLYRMLSPESGRTEGSITVQYSRYDYYSDTTAVLHSHVREIESGDVVHTAPTLLESTRFVYDTGFYISTDLLDEISETVQKESYRQASLFFGSDREAEAAAKRLCRAGYIAVASTETYSPDPFEMIADTILSIVMLLLWAAAIVFLAFFLTLCTSRTVGAFKGDMAIMRSMGIPVRVIRIGMYARMLIALLPAYLLTALAVVLVFRIPQTNGFFVYLYPYHYALIAIGMLALTLLVTRGQIRRLFGESVKRSLRGGDAE